MIREKMTRTLLGITVVAIMMSIPVFAKVGQEIATIHYNGIAISVNGSIVSTENEPFILDGRTYLPVRDVAEFMQLDVDWDDATQTVLLSRMSGIYQTEAEFLNSPDGAAFQITAFKAAKALLSSDSAALASCLKEPLEVEQAIVNLTYGYDDVEFLYLVWSLGSIVNEDQIRASYRYVISGEDSYTYVSMELVRVDDVWKVIWIGIEK